MAKPDGRYCSQCEQWKPFVDPKTGKPNFWRKGNKWRRQCIVCGNASRVRKPSKKLPGQIRGTRYSHIWTCVEDPTPEAVWKGGRHSSLLFRMTLDSGYFPEGLIFKAPSGELFRITGAECQPQRLEAI